MKGLKLLVASVAADQASKPMATANRATAWPKEACAGSSRMKSKGCGFTAGPKHSTTAASSAAWCRQPNSIAAAVSGAAPNGASMRPA